MAVQENRKAIRFISSLIERIIALSLNE